jgi:hypothetical protein
MGADEYGDPPCESRLVPFQRGNSNGNGRLDITDAIHTLSFPFGGREEPLCLDAAHANASGAIDVAEPWRSKHQ